MRKVRCVCVGISPLLMDRMSEEVLKSLDTGVRLQLQKDRPQEEKAKEKVYTDKDGKLALPAQMLIAALVTAGRNVKLGKKQVSTAQTTTLFDFLTVTSQHLYLTNGRDGKEPTWVPDSRRGVSNASASPVAVCVVRPRCDEWAFEVELTYDEKIAGRDSVLKLFANAGTSQGLGSFRPNKKGPYGMFRVIEWNDDAVASSDNTIKIVVDGKEEGKAAA